MDIRNWLKKKPSTNSAPNNSFFFDKTDKKSSFGSVKEIRSRKKKKPAETAIKNKKKRILDSSSDSEVESESIVISKNKKRIIDSSGDSDEEQNAKRCKKYELERNKRPVRMHISDSSTEEISPVKRKHSPIRSKLKIQSKLENLKHTSKFFKETSANDVFGNEPVKRNDKKLKDMQEKLKAFKPVKEDLALGDDAEFEAALVQLDEVGDNWADLSKISENRQSTSNIKNSAKFPIENNLVSEVEKRVESRNFEKNSTKNVNLPDSMSTGYGSADSAALSSDSQTPDDSITKLNPSITLPPHEDSSVSGNSVKEVTGTSTKHQSVPTAKRKRNDNLLVNKLIEKPMPSEPLPSSSSDNCSLWVEKYKPQSSKKIIGQQGDKSNVNKLIHWLKNWYKNNAGSKKASCVPGGWNKDPTGACFKAALLSGPPGVGKTTTVSLVCKELGFDLVEFNASDTRSKKLLQEEVSELLKCKSLLPFFNKQSSESSAVTSKHVLVMDEVDGMAGTEDRGGIQELIQLIKKTKIPIICMCNDRYHRKLKSFVNYCFDLRFSRPRVEQIKGYMMSVCFKEKLRISSETLTDIITSANNDVRLVLNHLSMLAADNNSQHLEAAKKYVKLSAFDVLRKVFSKEDHKTMSIHDKCDLFFFDYSIAPLFVQENYLSVKPLNPGAKNGKKKMELYARAAKCIGIGDLVDNQIRKNSSWSLLPTQAIFASYSPGEILEGYCGAQINFPSWLGKYSKQGRFDRLLQEIQIHTRLKISGSKESVNLDYAMHLKNRILAPLVERGSDGVKDALDILHQYDLLKEDLDSLQEICQWPNMVNTMANLETKVKSAFTRAYNKNPPVRPYSLVAPVKKTAAVETLLNEEEDDADADEKSDDDNDAMIVTKKKTATKNPDEIPASTSKSKTKTSTSTSSSKRSRKK